MPLLLTGFYKYFALVIVCFTIVVIVNILKNGNGPKNP